MPNIITRRSFLSSASRAGIGLGVASLMTIPPFLKRALAEGSIGINGKKLIFIFLRGGNDVASVRTDPTSARAFASPLMNASSKSRMLRKYAVTYPCAAAGWLATKPGLNNKQPIW